MEENPLSARELEILSSVATGATNAQVAQDLRISANTVKVHLRNIFAKLDVESRTEATTLAISKGWIRFGDAPLGLGLAGDETNNNQPKRSRLEIWKRAIFAGALILVAAVALLPPAESESGGDPFVDHASGLPASAARSMASRWASAAPMSEPRARLALVSQGDKLFAIGGDSSSGVIGTVEEFLSDDAIWVTRTDKPIPAANIGAVESDGRIFVPGGYGQQGEALQVLEIYEPAGDQWTEGAPMPQPRFGYAIAILNGEVFVIGGSDGEEYVTTVFIYDPSNNQWRAGPPIPGEPRGFLAAATVGNRVFVVGGFDGTRETDRCSVLDSDPESGSLRWSDCASLLTSRAGHAVAGAGGYLYVIGGGWETYLYFSERYDPASDSWTSFGTPILGQWRTLGAAPVRHGDDVVLHAVGGWSGDYVASNEIYRPFYYVNLPIIP